MGVRYQHGHLRLKKRKNQISCWEFMWREQGTSGKRTHRTVVIGSLEQYPTEELAQAAVNGFRMRINEARNRLPYQAISVADLVDHYLETELAAEWHTYSTRVTYREFLNRWIKRDWGAVDIKDVRTVAVEHWLRRLRRKDGDDLANSTKAKIRGVMSVLFNHAIRYEWLEQGKNPITLVRQSAQRKSTPVVLEPYQVKNLLSELENPFRMMVLLDVTTGLRRSELFALKWSDIDFASLIIDIRRSMFEGVVGNCKTQASRRPIPLPLEIAADLWLWKETTRYAAPDDWVFASPRVKGRSSWRPDGVLTKVIQPAAVRAGIKERIGWHTFRHTYSTALIANGENVKVVQELMRHATCRFTLEVYTQARARVKHEAQQRLVELVLPEKELTSDIKLRRSGPPETLEED